MESIYVSEMAREDLAFLLDLWHNPVVMQYADEFPDLRGWSRSADPATAWSLYLKMRAALGREYSQLILKLGDGIPIGESFFAPLTEGATFGKWQKPEHTVTVLGDIKLAPGCWGQGWGTAGMREVVRYAFERTACELFCVPPHRQNPAAFRVYEKVGFELVEGMRSHHNHRVMELTRTRYWELYGEQGS